MTIARRLWLGFGTLLAIFAVVVIGVVIWLHTLEQGFHQMMSVALPQTAAAHDMELRSVGIGMEVMRYLDTGDPTARQRFAENAAQFEQAQARYDGLATTQRHIDLGRRVGVLRTEYTALGESLMAQEDAVRGLYPQVVNNIEAIRAAIGGDGGRGSHNSLSAGTLEADVGEVELWLARYFLTANDTYRRRLFDAAKSFMRGIETLSHGRLTAKQQRWVNDLRTRFAQTMSQVKEAVLLHDVQMTQTAKFGELRKQLDGLLDNEITLLTEEDLNAATKSARGTVRSLQSAVSFLLLAGLLIGLSTSIVVGRATLKAQETLRVTLRSIGDAVISTDRDGRVTLLNSVAQSLTGWTEAEATGQPVQTVFRIVNSAGAPIDNPVERVVREGVVVALDNRTTLLAKDGSARSIEDSAAPIRDDRGHITGVVLIFRDVTERRYNEAEIARLLADEHHRQESLRKVAAASLTVNSALSVDSVVGVITEEARNIIGTNQSFSRVKSSTEPPRWVAGRSLSDKYAAWRTPDVDLDKDGPYKLVCESNQPLRWTQDDVEDYFEVPQHAENSTRPPLNGWLAAPLVGRNGRNIGVIELSDKYEGEFTEADEAILTQLAHVVAPAIENAALYEELRVADQRKDEFLATLAHELRNPLAPIRNALELLRIRSDGSTTAHAREMMERQVEQLVRLVDDLIDLSRITRGKIELRKQRLALSAVIDSALETSRPLLNAAGHQLTVSLPGESVDVDADLTRLAQVFVNLLDNAAKYTPSGGNIWLTAERQGPEVVVTVRDSGVGIPAAALPRIFDMFSQVDQSLERAPSGLGIGLSLVRRLVEMHGGSISARSAGEGQGSTFIVRLPLAQARPRLEKRMPAKESETAPSAVSLRILVVDDNRDAADSLSALLGLWGHKAHVVNDGPSAVQAAEEFGPDVVLLDIGLPGLNGYEVARRMRTHQSLNNVTLIAVTGWAQPEDRRRSREAGFDHHMVKPVDLDALREVLDAVVATHSTPPQAAAAGQSI